jgi:hypothetical protein
VAASGPKPTDVFEYYRRTKEALVHLKATLLNLSRPIDPTSQFFGMLPREIDEDVGRMSVELEIQINLLLIASFEASLRIDFRDRIERRGKDSVSRRFRALEKRRKAEGGKYVGLNEILEVWTDESIGLSVWPVVRLFQYRNWVAHGRYWVEKRSGLKDPAPIDVWDIIRHFRNSLPGFEILAAQPP